MKPLLRTAVLLLLGGAAVHAARPFATDDAGMVAAGAYELEAGYDLWQDAGAASIGFKHGLTEKMDLGVGFGFTTVTEPKNSFSAAALCLKYALVPDLLSASFAAEIGSSSYAINGIFSRPAGPLAVNANLGYATGDSSITCALALLYPAGALTIGAEIGGDQETQTWLAGLQYILREGLVIDAGFAGDLDLEEKTAAFGLHFEF